MGWGQSPEVERSCHWSVGLGRSPAVTLRRHWSLKVWIDTERLHGSDVDLDVELPNADLETTAG